MEWHGFDDYASESLFSKKVKKNPNVLDHPWLPFRQFKHVEPAAICQTCHSTSPTKKQNCAELFFKDKTTSGAIIAK